MTYVELATLTNEKGSSQMFRVTQEGKLKKQEMEDATHRYVIWLRDIAENHARKCKMTIETLSSSFPHYLCKNEGDKDFIKFIKYLDKFANELWPKVKRQYSISEGQAAAVFATNDFDDPIQGVDPDGRRELVEGLGVDESGGLNLLIVDGGGSSLNL